MTCSVRGSRLLDSVRWFEDFGGNRRDGLCGKCNIFLIFIRTSDDGGLGLSICS